MYENLTYEQLLKRMLEYIETHNTNIDTREGSVVWYGQAPAALELERMYQALDAVLAETFADTATRPYLIKRAAERGLHPYSATAAVLRGEFTPASLGVPIGARFSLNDLNYIITEQIEPGAYRLECETPGEVGNDYFGTLIPIEYIPGLETATLTSIILPGEDEEETEHFRQRYFASLEAEAFGGNVADYKAKVNAIQGVGGVKVYRAWNGDVRPAEMVPSQPVIDELEQLTTTEQTRAWLDTMATAAGDGLLTVGGTVRLVIIGSDYSIPTPEVVELVQTTIDPCENHGEGVGLAPIGHVVTVRAVEATVIHITADITYSSGWDWAALQPYAEEAIDGYFLELGRSWADSDEPLVVRISQIENRLLNLPGVVDVTGTTINDEEANVILPQDHIPVRGNVDG